MKCQSLKGWALILNDWKGRGQSFICLWLLVLLGLFSGSLWLDRARCRACSDRSPCPAVGLWPRAPASHRTPCFPNRFFTERRSFSWATYSPYCNPSPVLGKSYFHNIPQTADPKAGGRVGGPGGGERAPVTGKTWSGWERGQHPGEK